MPCAGCHAGQIGNVTHDVGRKHDVGTAMLGDDLFGQLTVEERADGANPAVARYVGDVHRRLDTEMTNAALLEMTQRDAVVAAEFHDERIGTPGEDISYDCLGKGLEVRLHVARSA